MIRLARFQSQTPAGRFGWVRLSARPFAVLAGVAMCVSLAGCGDNAARTPTQAAAQQEMKAAGNDLKDAANATGAAIKDASVDAKPAADKLAVSAKEGLANLSDATGTAAAKAGHALEKAGEKTDAAAHRAADHARESAQNTQQ